MQAPEMKLSLGRPFPRQPTSVTHQPLSGQWGAPWKAPCLGRRMQLTDGCSLQTEAAYRGESQLSCDLGRVEDLFTGR